MEIGLLIVGIFISLVGLMFVLKPENPIRLEKWKNEVLLGAAFMPTERTKTIYKVTGFIMLALGIASIIGSFF